MIAGLAPLSAQVPVADSVAVDTLPPVFTDTLRVRFSKDSVDSEVIYSARDSSDVDNREKKVFLYGEASVKYKDYVIEADIIILDLEKNIATAEGVPGMRGYARFKDASQDVEADRLQYNFKTKKGIVYSSRTKEGDLYVRSGVTKFVSDEEQNEDGVLYGKDGVFTTCDAPVPHYGIRSRQQKIVPNKVVVVGPANLEISQVPTPLVLPFGFFPILKGVRKGIIFPRDYEYSEQWGFGLRGIGYYIPVSDRIDMTILTDVYLRGSWGATLQSNYKVNYKYNGRVELGYSLRKQENLSTGLDDGVRSFKILWSHNQDQRAHPYRTFNGSVNIQTFNFQSLNFNDAASVFTNTLNSNVSYSQRFAGKPYTLSASFTHSQNTQTRIMSISFPNLDFQMQRLFPFKRKNQGGNKPRWYEDISLQYNSKMSNRFETTDSTLFTRKTLEDAQFGVQHNASLASNLRIFKYINVVPGVNYREIWQLRTVNKYFDPNFRFIPRDTLVNAEMDTIIRYDTIRGELITERVPGFRAWRTIDVNATLNTQIFGTVLFKRGLVKGLRHVIKPSVSLSYSPAYNRESLDYWRKVQRDIYAIDSVFYSVFEGGIFGTPPNSGQRLALNYSLNNIFEAKYRMRRDTADRKFRLFDNIVVNGDYNFAADSLKFSPVRISGTHRLFKGMTTVTANLMLDPYIRNERDQRVNILAWDAERVLLKFVNFSASFNSSLSMSTLRGWFSGKDTPATGPAAPGTAPAAGSLRSFWDLIDGFSINHTLLLGVARMGDRDTFMIGTNNVQVTGAVQLSKNWRITFGSIGYDFNSKRMTYPDLGFFRDLHCWEMGMNWQPLRGTYSFYIRVKPSTLDFLKVPYRKNNIDGLQQF